MTAQRGVSRHDLARVPEPVHGYPVLATSVHNRVGNVAIIAVPDTYDARRRHRALARIDLLDQERRAGRLDEASYLVGREVERVFEGMSHIAGGGQWLEGDRVDGATSAEQIRPLLPGGTACRGLDGCAARPSPQPRAPQRRTRRRRRPPR